MGGEAYVEPTVVAGLALLAAGASGTVEPAVSEAADWLVSIQRTDGALGLCTGLPDPCWATPHAVLLWAGLGGYQSQRALATAWLLSVSGETILLDEAVAVDIGHDTTIPGWGWVQGTPSWIEPTAWALLALRREGWSDHPRVGDGIRMICDRAIPSGGWNFGNRAVFGSILPPQPDLTALALLALVGSACDERLIERGCRFLASTLPGIRSPRSLAWGLLALDAWQRKPREGETWLAESFAYVARNRPTPLDLAQLLLAANPRSLELLAARHPQPTESR